MDDIVTTYAYDLKGRMIRTIYGHADTASPRNYIEVEYADGLEPTRKTTDTRGFVTKAYYDKSGQLVESESDITSLEKATTEYTYDLLGQMIELKDPESKSTYYTYGVGGRLEKIELPGSDIADHVFSYDPRGNRIGADFGNGLIEYAFDEWDRLIRVDHPGSNDYDVFSYTHFDDHFAHGERRTATRLSGVTPQSEVISEYDPLGNLRMEKIVHGSTGPTHTMNYIYDGAGRMTAVTYPDDYLIEYEYDQAGRLKEVSQDLQTLDDLASFNYLKNGFLEKIHFANGATTTYLTTAADRYRPTEIKTIFGETPIFHQTYQWDYEGNVTEINGATQTYDGLGRLTTASTPTDSVGGGTYTTMYTYDKAGNRLTEVQPGSTRTYSYDAPHLGNAMTQVMSTGEPTEQFEYSISGAIITREKDGVTTEYIYNKFNHLTDVKVDSQPVARYRYDAYGRLVETVEYLTGGIHTTRRVPFGTETAYEEVVEGSDTRTRNYIYANGRYIAKVETLNNGDPETYFYHGDHLGSTRTVSTSTTSDGTMAYDAFGNVINTTGNADDHNHRFTGKLQDSTGLYYFGARFYDPTIGRFINLDPAMDGLNWYAYTYNNPLKYVDPTGMLIADYSEGYDWPTGVTIEEGDTLSSVAYEFYGDRSVAPYLAEINDLTDLDTVYPGQFIYLPGAIAGDEESFFQLGFHDGGVVPTHDLFLAIVGTTTLVRAGVSIYHWISNQILLSHVDVNKLNHIFGKPSHNLDSYLNAYRGNQVAAYRALARVTQRHVSNNNITGVFTESVRVGQFNVTVRGNVVDGIAKIGTAYISKPSP